MLKEATDTIPATRRWFQFSLKSLLIVMVFAAGYFGGLATMMRQAEHARQDAMRQADRAAQMANESRMQAEEAMMQAIKAKEAEMRARKNFEQAISVAAAAQEKLEDARSDVDPLEVNFEPQGA